MALHVTGVVATQANEPTERRTIVVPDPGPTDVVVRIRACGVCHTDLHYRNGGISDDFPFLLGHEAAGEVQSGDTVAVFGCGGVGDAAILGARLKGARTIVAVDLDDRKLEWAKGFGATHTVNAAKEDAVEAVRAATGGFGADVVVEAVGR